MDVNTIIKEFFTENPTTKLGELANKFAEEHNLKILQIQTDIVSVRSFSDGRGNTNVRILTVLYQKE